MKIYNVKFDPVYPVGCGLVLKASDAEEAERIARATITHTDDIIIHEVDISESGVIFYRSGDY